jgi:hypothetical protein
MLAVCDVCKELKGLRCYYNECTRGWISEISSQLWWLEELGLTNFGASANGANIFAYHLTELARNGASWLKINSYITQLEAERSTEYYRGLARRYK